MNTNLQFIHFILHGIVMGMHIVGFQSCMEFIRMYQHCPPTRVTYLCKTFLDEKNTDNRISLDVIICFASMILLLHLVPLYISLRKEKIHFIRWIVFLMGFSMDVFLNLSYTPFYVSSGLSCVFMALWGCIIISWIFYWKALSTPVPVDVPNKIK